MVILLKHRIYERLQIHQKSERHQHPDIDLPRFGRSYVCNDDLFSRVMDEVTKALHRLLRIEKPKGKNTFKTKL